MRTATCNLRHLPVFRGYRGTPCLPLGWEWLLDLEFGRARVRDLRGSRDAFGLRSNMDDKETFKTLHMSNRRAALTRLTPLSYF